MDSSSVLLALEERKRWEARRSRIEASLLQIERRRAFLLRELENVRRRIAQYAALIAEPRPPPVTIGSAVSGYSLLR